MLYLINNVKVSECHFWDCMEKDTKSKAKTGLDEMLDYMYRDICIEDFTIIASEVLKKCRPLRYQEMLNERQGFLWQEYFSKAKQGEKVNIDGVLYQITIGDED